MQRGVEEAHLGRGPRRRHLARQLDCPGLARLHDLGRRRPRCQPPARRAHRLVDLQVVLHLVGLVLSERRAERGATRARRVGCRPACQPAASAAVQRKKLVESIYECSSSSSTERRAAERSGAERSRAEQSAARGAAIGLQNYSVRLRPSSRCTAVTVVCVMTAYWGQLHDRKMRAGAASPPP